MLSEKRPAPFVLISTSNGAMIVNRNDYQMTSHNQGFGVSYQIMNNSCWNQDEVLFVLNLLRLRRKYYGDGVVAIDCGANLGMHTVEWAKLMPTWGHVWAFEAQEKIFYALAGNVIVNNCLNVTAKHAAVGAQNGHIDIPEPNYLVPSSFGSFELKKRQQTEFIGQEVDYDAPTKRVDLLALDSLPIERVDFIKIDVEGMEEEVLAGAENLIKQHHPMMSIEVIKSDQVRLVDFLTRRGYSVFPFQLNVLAVHKTDACLKHIKYENKALKLKA